MHPYLTLHVTPNDDSQAIRQAYLEAVRRHPPESDPEGFRLINDAYEMIKTEDARLSREIGGKISGSTVLASPMEAAWKFFEADPDPKPPAEADFYTFLRS
jgi:curved DNA-binding protein CbpA